MKCLKIGLAPKKMDRNGEHMINSTQWVEAVRLKWPRCLGAAYV